jgi:hypothetical protein
LGKREVRRLRRTPNGLQSRRSLREMVLSELGEVLFRSAPDNYDVSSIDVLAAANSPDLTQTTSSAARNSRKNVSTSAAVL